MFAICASRVSQGNILICKQSFDSLHGAKLLGAAAWRSCDRVFPCCGSMSCSRQGNNTRKNQEGRGGARTRATWTLLLVLFLPFPSNKRLCLGKHKWLSRGEQLNCHRYIFRVLSLSALLLLTGHVTGVGRQASKRTRARLISFRWIVCALPAYRQADPQEGRKICFVVVLAMQRARRGCYR